MGCALVGGWILEDVEEHIGEVFAAGLLLECGECSLEAELPVEHDSEAAAESLGFVESVSAEDDGFALLSEQGGVVEDAFAADDVETTSGFIHQDNWWIMHE
jgi:hypothetical protein